MKAAIYVTTVLLVFAFVTVVYGEEEEGHHASATAQNEAGKPGETGGHEHAHWGFSPVSLIVPMGIATLSPIAVTVFLGLFRRRLPKLMFKWHKRTGVLALLAGATHAALVLLIY